MERNKTTIKTANRINSVQEYYFSRKLEEIAKMKALGVSVINAGIGSPDLAPSTETINTLIESSRDPNNHAYQTYIGVAKLRIAFANWYKQYFNVELNPDNEILPLIGSKEGIMHVSMAYLNQGDEVLIPNPGYPSYSSVSNLLEARIKTYDLLESNNWYPDLNLLEKNDLSKVKIMWVNYPNMPTGSKANIDLFKRLVEFGHKHNILICNDNPYSFILNNEQLSIFSVDGAKEIALELNSLSKSHNMAGWRMGMLAANSEIIKNVLKVKSNMDSGMFLPIQLASAQALSNPVSWYNGINDTYSKRRNIVFDILDELKCKYDRNQVGMFVWAKVSDKFSNGEELSEFILNKASVFITPGFIFGSNGDKYIRMSLCCNEETLFEIKNRIKNLNM